MEVKPYGDACSVSYHSSSRSLRIHFSISPRFPVSKRPLRDGFGCELLLRTTVLHAPSGLSSTASMPEACSTETFHYSRLRLYFREVGGSLASQCTRVARP